KMRMVRLASCAALALALAACNQQVPADQASSEATGAQTDPDGKPGLVLSGGKLALPAVSGNPAAAYFTLTNTGEKAATVAAVHVEGAGMAMLHETMQMDGHSSMQMMKSVDVAPGEALAFAPGGKHV